MKSAYYSFIHAFRISYEVDRNRTFELNMFVISIKSFPLGFHSFLRITHFYSVPQKIFRMSSRCEWQKRSALHALIGAITTAMLRVAGNQVYCDLSHYHYSIDLLFSLTLVPLAVWLHLTNGTSLHSFTRGKWRPARIGLISLGYVAVVSICVLNAFGTHQVASLNYRLGTEVASVAHYHQLSKEIPTAFGSRLHFAKVVNKDGCAAQDLSAVWRRSPATFQLSHRNYAAVDYLISCGWVAQAVVWLLAWLNFLWDNHNNSDSTPRLTQVKVDSTPFFSDSTSTSFPTDIDQLHRETLCSLEYHKKFMNTRANQIRL